MTTVIYWFRSDCRVHDHPGLQAALRDATRLLPVFVDDPRQQQPDRWGFAPRGRHRQVFLADTLADLDASLRRLGNGLEIVTGTPETVLPALARACGASRIVCEDIPCPQEQGAVRAIRAAGITVQTIWHATLIAPRQLPFAVADLPGVFTRFRVRIEEAGVLPLQPLPEPVSLPPRPAACPVPDVPPRLARPEPAHDPRSAFPYAEPAWQGGEQAALRHLHAYFSDDRAPTYKATRNGLTGTSYSSKWSPWLATGALSPRRVFAALRDHEAEAGVSDGSYWLWFELLWRDYFRFLHARHGSRLYRVEGLGQLPPPRHDARRFADWCAGRSGQAFVDAGMRDLAATGFLSNRMRQMVASWLIHDVPGDWRAGAAWFESQLIDYDPCSNQGNWLYLAGRGTDPRGVRRFCPRRQAEQYDPDGAYRRVWSARA